jgi:DNA repair protein RadA/Sms
MGEIGLAGELRRVRDLPQRIAEAARLGFAMAVVPAEPFETPARSSRGPQEPPGQAGVRRERTDRSVDGMRVVQAPDVASALGLLHLDRRTKHALEVVDEG